MLAADRGKTGRSREGCENQGAAYGVALLGQTRHEGQHSEARNRRNGGDDADPGGVDSDGAQPHRKERQMGAKQTEQRAVEQRHRTRESASGLLRRDGDL